jgi:hypothetical protein
MKLAVITRLTIIATGAAIVCGLGLAGIATGTASHRPRHRSPYKGSGHSSYETTGQACFGATWQGTGAWNTDYKATVPAPGQGVDTTTDKDSSGYSWDLSEVASGADCALELLRFPGSKPTGGASWNRGFTRLGANGHDVYTAPDQPPVSTTCTKAKIEHAGSASVTGDMSIKLKGSSIIFVMSLDLPIVDCGAYSAPGQDVPGGKVGAFLSSDSVAVPRAVFEKDGKVTITISSDPKHGSKPNCGVHADPPSTVTCSQSGAWQGTLTLRQG